MSMLPTSMLAAEQEAAVLRPWGDLPLVAVQAMAQHLPASRKAALRVVCKPWRDAVARQFTQLYLGPGSVELQPHLAHGNSSALQLAFPALDTVHFTTSNSREYSDTYHQVGVCTACL